MSWSYNFQINFGFTWSKMKNMYCQKRKISNYFFYLVSGIKYIAELKLQYFSVK